MTDKPILFSGPMVNAILEGRKTQTRRVLKPQPDNTSDPSGCGECGSENRYGYWAPVAEIRPYQVGDRLYVREAWRSWIGWDHRPPRWMRPRTVLVRYEADGSLGDWCTHETEKGKFRQGMHMPRWASRLTLVVTDVRVQRLQGISGPDAKAEGVSSLLSGTERLGPNGSYRSNFKDLWNSINESRGFGWDANPWVVAVTYETHHCNIDQMEAPDE